MTTTRDKARAMTLALHHEAEKLRERLGVTG